MPGRIIVRSLRADDRDRLQAFYLGLSPRSRYLRFFARSVARDAGASCCESMARENAPPCLVAIDLGPPEMIVGEALGAWEGPTSAEMALSVADDYQRRGLGSALFEALAAAAGHRGIRTLRAEVLIDNCGMLALLRARHSVVIGVPPLPALSLGVATDASMPDWPQRPGARVLVEGLGWLALTGTDAHTLAANGCSLLACPGDPGHGGPRADCPVLGGHRCALRDAADIVLCRFPGLDRVEDADQVSPRPGQALSVS